MRAISKSRPAEAATQQALNQTWGGVLKTHPAADLFPRLPDPELLELGEDIKRHNLHTPVVIFTDQDGAEWLLDGRNRLDAMERIGLPIIKDGELNPDIVHRISGNIDPFEWVLSANVLRRHLTREQKEDVLAKVLKERPGQSNRTIAKQVRVDHKTVGKVRDKLEATGEIPQLKKTTGADGKDRKRPLRKSKSWSALTDPEINDLAAKAQLSADQFKNVAVVIDERQQNNRRRASTADRTAIDAYLKTIDGEQKKKPTEQPSEGSVAMRLIERNFVVALPTLNDESSWPPLNAGRKKRLQKTLKKLKGVCSELIELAKPVPRRGRPRKA